MSQSETAISIRGLSKAYTIDPGALRRPTFRDVVGNRVKHPFARTPTETFWALKDVSLDISKGEVVGIIGRNGAGKSTLLKILSRITEPTCGRIELFGRVGSLLEVGTGFHPELTGRENIFLNGAILGMMRAEIRKQFDAIVDFAEIEQFLDTPVKRYSSGMYVRLAFAVAAHLEPEILVVDEVLAVGDAEFQKKCLGKMGDVAKRGRTVLFVSHNMTAVSALCDRACLFAKGKLSQSGPTQAIVHQYLSRVSGAQDPAPMWTHRNRGRLINVDSVRLLVSGRPSPLIRAGESCSLRVGYRLLAPEAIGSPLSISLMLYGDGQKLANLWTNCLGQRFPCLPSGTLTCNIAKWPFRNQQIRVDVYTHVGAEAQDWIEESLVFDSHDGDFYRTGVITNPDQGLMFLDHNWSNDAV